MEISVFRSNSRRVVDLPKLFLIYLIIKVRRSHDLYIMNAVESKVDLRSNRWIVRWLLCGCALIMMMVIIGGITRLTHSGLSMVKWSVFGSVPPMSQDRWEVLFDQYKLSPEFKLINSDYSIEDFKSIFWWEFIHRFLGRTIGIVFILPFLWFVVKKQLPAGYLRKLIFLLGLGGLQGVFGWIMVKSGLNQVPHVSHYLLALHLGTAFLTFGYTFWLALGLMMSGKDTSEVPSRLKQLVRLELVLVAIQIVYGAFVAGLKAGLYYPQFPMMGDHWLPPDATFMSPMWKNLLENPVGVQFIHRVLAMLIVVNTVVLLAWARNTNLSSAFRSGLRYLAAIVVVQFTLGVITLLMQVPVFAASVHQLGAFFLLAVCIYLLHEQWRSSKVKNGISHHHKSGEIRAGDQADTNARYIFSFAGIGNNVCHSKCESEPQDAENEKHGEESFASKLSVQNNKNNDVKYVS